MGKKILLITFIALLTLSLVYAITLTADATESVKVPIAALGTMCLVDPATNECTDKQGEALFGNAVVKNKNNGDEFGMFLVQFGGNFYRATNLARVYEEGTTKLLGMRGELSQLLPDGTEVTTTGEVKTSQEEGKVAQKRPVPVGEFNVVFDGLVLQDSEECGEYNYLDEQGQPVKGKSTRECSRKSGIMVSGEYKELELIFNYPNGKSDKYKLVSIDKTTRFEWKPSEGK